MSSSLKKYVGWPFITFLMGQTPRSLDWLVRRLMMFHLLLSLASDNLPHSEINQSCSALL